jgi:oligoendopeptidase F
MPAKQRVARATKSRAIVRPPARAVPRLGALPEWNLNDLYAGIDDPHVKRDLDRADAECVAFEQAYKGKLAALVEAPVRPARPSKHASPAWRQRSCRASPHLG